MKNLPEIKLGVVVGSTDWLPQTQAEQTQIDLTKILDERYPGGKEYVCSIIVNDNEVNVKRALRDLIKAECNALCICFANYGPESAGPLLAEEFNGPVMMIGVSDEGEEPLRSERRDTLSGFINACYALYLRGSQVYLPDTPIGPFWQCADMIHEFTIIARALIAVKDLKLITFAPRPASYLAASAPEHPLYDIGVDLSQYSELELYNSYLKHAEDARIEKVMSEMTEELANGQNQYPGLLSKLAQYEITINDWVRGHKGDKRYVAMTGTCWPAFPVSYGFVPCYVNSRLTGRGIPVACEADVYGALSEYIGQCVSGDTVTLLNINNNIPQSIYEDRIEEILFNNRKYTLSDLFLGYHCGVTCSDRLCDKILAPHYVNDQLIGLEGAGAALHGRIKPGSVTIFRIQPSKEGTLKAYIAQGELLPVEVDTYGGYGIIAIPEFGRFLRHVVLEEHFPNHTVVLFGHYEKLLGAVLRQLGISEIFDNHPANIPYETERMSDFF